MSDAQTQRHYGLIAGFTAYGIWGLLPVYIKALHGVDALELLAHRALWTVLLMAAILGLRRHFGALWAALSHGRTLALLALSSVLIAGNWLIYAWAILHDRVLDTSLGYFINPLFSVALGVLLLRERLRAVQWCAIALAAVGVVVKAWLAGTWPWLAIGLALSFAFYGLVRKQLQIDPVVGLMVETLFMVPFALLWFLGPLGSIWTHAPVVNGLLLLAGVLTAVPLLCFTFAARRLPLSTLGLMQYLAPTMVFALAVFVYNEPVGLGNIVAFALIWAGLAVFAIDGLRLSRAGRRG